MINLANALKLLADDTRLRILRLVGREPLNVKELTSILGLAQSGISRHLGLLRKAGLVEEQREGVWSYYRVSTMARLGERSNGNGETMDEDLHEAWQFVQARIMSSDDPFHDLPRLAEVLRQRENFGGGLSEKLLEPGQSWFAWSRALHHLLPALDAIDLGCGDGTITVEISRFADTVVGVDANPRALEAARRRAEREHRTNVEFREGRIERLHEPAERYDLAVFSQSLHHMESPEDGISQAVRVLRPGGRLLIVDLASHEQEWVISKLGHHHLGFVPTEVEAMMSRNGLTGVSHEMVNQRRDEVFRVFVATGLKPRYRNQAAELFMV